MAPSRQRASTASTNTRSCWRQLLLRLRRWRHIGLPLRRRHSACKCRFARRQAACRNQSSTGRQRGNKRWRSFVAQHAGPWGHHSDRVVTDLRVASRRCSCSPARRHWRICVARRIPGAAVAAFGRTLLQVRALWQRGWRGSACRKQRRGLRRDGRGSWRRRPHGSRWRHPRHGTVWTRSHRVSVHGRHSPTRNASEPKTGSLIEWRL